MAADSPMFTTTRLDVCLSGEAGSSAIELHTRLAHARMGCEGSGHRSRQLTHVPPHSSHLVGFGQYSCRCAAETYATRGHQNHDEYLWRCLKYGVFRFFFPGYAESLAGRDVLTFVLQLVPFERFVFVMSALEGVLLAGVLDFVELHKAGSREGAGAGDAASGSG